MSAQRGVKLLADEELRLPPAMLRKRRGRRDSSQPVQDQCLSWRGLLGSYSVMSAGACNVREPPLIATRNGSMPAWQCRPSSPDRGCCIVK